MRIDIALSLLFGVSGLIGLFIVWYHLFSFNENSKNSERKRGDGK